MGEDRRIGGKYTLASERNRAVGDELLVERVARALNLEAGRQRGLAFEDDWETLTEQERGGWRLCARAGLEAADLIPLQDYEEVKAQLAAGFEAAAGEAAKESYKEWLNTPEGQAWLRKVNEWEKRAEQAESELEQVKAERDRLELEVENLDTALLHRCQKAEAALASSVPRERWEEAAKLLRRLSEWDVMQVTGDGNYWKQEIARVLSPCPPAGRRGVSYRYPVCRDLQREGCCCCLEGPDSFGNYELIPQQMCPLHGPKGRNSAEDDARRLAEDYETPNVHFHGTGSHPPDSREAE